MTQGLDGTRVLAASAVVGDGKGKVLLVLRGAEPEKNCWSVPGGSAEPGEILSRTAQRETFEETGLHVDILEELWCVKIPTGDGRVYEVHDFRAVAVGGSLRAGDDAKEARWFAAHELEGIPLTRNLRDYLDRAGLWRVAGT